jgi:hypothetical protein
VGPARTGKTMTLIWRDRDGHQPGDAVVQMSETGANFRAWISISDAQPGGACARLCQARDDNTFDKSSAQDR